MGQRLRVEAPVGVLTQELRAALAARKEQILARLRADPLVSSEAHAIADGHLVEARERLGAVLVRSAHYGEIWLALDPCMVAELVAEDGASPRPVLLVEDVARLRGKSKAAIRAVLEVARVFPGARVFS